VEPVSRFDRTLRWYPQEWRKRYGDELVALLEDTYGRGPVPLRDQLSLVKAGTLERLRGPQGARDRDASQERVRSGSLLVLWAWAVFIVAGAGFAKFTEHWDLATPPGDRRVPAAAYDAVQWTAILGAVMVLATAALCLPALVRLVSHNGWPEIRRPVVRAGLVAAATILYGAGVVVWAHHLPARSRNGGLWSYSLGAAIWALLIAASIASCAGAAVAVVRRLRLGPRVLRTQAVLALSMTLVMAVVTGGTVTWWISVARVAPGFLGSGPPGSAGSLVPPMLAIAGLLMASGLGAAVLGAGWIAGSVRHLPADPTPPDAA
jgi:hypothetical protein